MAQFQSFAALGDSFTEGVGDPTAEGAGLRGWADRFAEHLAGRWSELRYANLAIRGKLLSEVLDEQVYASGGNARCRDDQGVEFQLYQPNPGY